MYRFTVLPNILYFNGSKSVKDEAAYSIHQTLVACLCAEKVAYIDSIAYSRGS